MKSLFIALSVITALSSTDSVAASVPREWNEMLLQAVRYDYARPTVTARNLYHLSIALYDSWAIYDPKAQNYYIDFKREAADVASARKITTSYAAYRIILARFDAAPKAEAVKHEATALMKQLGLDPNFTEMDETPAGAGNTIAQMILNYFDNDGSLEHEAYESPADLYTFLNPPLMVALAGVGKILNVNLWQPLSLEVIIDQGGNPLPGKVQSPLTLHWGSLPPFALTETDKNPGTGLYLDPGAPPEFGGAGHYDFRDSMERVIEYSSWLDPADSIELDISPASLGNNTLGKNDGKGHASNPIRNRPYAEQRVYRGDYARVLAEFWADGPQSETPPGHWNVVANRACADPDMQKRWMGKGPVLPDDEWDVKMYLALNGALYDASIAAWGIKGYYQGSRPISAIRYMGSLGQSSDPTLPSYDLKGLSLKPGLIELITDEFTQPGERFAHLVGNEGKIAIRSWRGAPLEQGAPNLGVGWILAENWLPYQKATFVTPPFPGYVSGHSTFSRAAAEVLTAITASKYFPGGMGEYRFKPDVSLTFEAGPSREIKLQWATYYDAADQSARSRIFGGIHGDIDDFPARKIGSVIGKRAVARMNTLLRKN